MIDLNSQVFLRDPFIKTDAQIPPATVIDKRRDATGIFWRYLLKFEDGSASWHCDIEIKTE